MPPSALTLSKYAPIALPIAPYADAGPEYGLMLPTLISLSVAPGSYFFCASAVPAMASDARPASASEMDLNYIIIEASFLAKYTQQRLAQPPGRPDQPLARARSRTQTPRKPPITPVGIKYIKPISNTP